MVITDDFVYIHMPKTGGTFVEAALERVYSGRRRGVYIDTSRKRDRRKIGGRDQHQTLRELPAKYRDRPVAFTVRNPFDHWVSYYEFGWWRTHPGDTFDERRIRERYPHYPEISFDEYLRACYEPELLEPRSMPDALTDRLTVSGVGPLSWEYVRFLSERPEDELDDPEGFFRGAHSFGTPAELHLLRQEVLSRALYDFLLSVGHSVESVSFVLDMGRVHPQGGPRRQSPEWEGYYNPGLLELVREREAFLFSVFPEYA